MMADNGRQAANAARLQAMADGAPDPVAQMMGLEAPTEEKLQMKAGPVVLQRNDDDPPSGGTGTTLGGMFRTGMNGIASFFGGLNVRQHSYATTPVFLGDATDTFNANTAFRILSQGPVGLTVPGAIRGEGGVQFGPRIEGGTAYAFMGGPVTTTSDAETATISNVVQDGHLFGGRVDQRIWEENGRVMTQIFGTGYGNFSRINEVMGVPLFTTMAHFQRQYIRDLRD
ncbi:MAG: hypothetical protein IIA92_02935 [Chloroflexi bacterium]|nr:hypothetical protein [Chloroflexota bacterium]